MYKYVLNSVVKISMMFAKYFEYYTTILREAVFFRGHAVHEFVFIKIDKQIDTLLISFIVTRIA